MSDLQARGTAAARTVSPPPRAQTFSAVSPSRARSSRLYVITLTTALQVCTEKEERGSCTDFTIKWFFKQKDGRLHHAMCSVFTAIILCTGRCDRFWYGGCEAGRNHFNTEAACQVL